MDVEKVIRILGYIVYTALWSPVLVLLLLIGPIVWLIVFMRMGMTVKECLELLGYALKNSIQHDMEFIRTGKWY